MLKISILMPTYNDEKHIASAIKSVLSQTYPHWELLIMDDGSTDNTTSVVKTFPDNRIKFFQQSNQGQLKALNNLSSEISGDIVMMFHSDDLLYKKTALEHNIKYFENSSIDGIYSSIVQFYQSGKPDLTVPTVKKLDNNSPKKLLMLLGSNFIPDPFFIRKEKFFSHVQYNYLIWNYQYWLDFGTTRIKSLNLLYSEHPWYYYRISDENYSNSIIGCFETYLGRLRSIYLLSDYYSAPFPSIQKELIRRFNIKGIALPFAASNKHMAKIIKILIGNMKKRTPGAYTWLFEQLLIFYNKPSKRMLELSSEIKSIYLGYEGRKFYNALVKKDIPAVYNEIIAELQDGFSAITVKNLTEKQELGNILKFLCIRTKIIIK